jgi:hypothetical protein
VTAVICVALTTVTEVAGVVPKKTVAPAVKFCPEMVMVVPPVFGAVLGETEETTGGLTKV